MLKCKWVVTTSRSSLDVPITAASRANSNMAVKLSSMVALGTEEATNSTINSEVATAITTTAADKEVVEAEADLKEDMGTSSSTNMEGGE